VSRTVAQFSCGAASAVATKLAIADDPATVVLNAYLANEHPDNRRFADDCARWFGRPITVLRDEKYGADIIQVFRRRQWIKGRDGASCTKALKRELLDAWRQPDDVIVLGFTVEEVDRFEDWTERSGIKARAPLIDQQLTKDDCKAMVQRAGIVLPLMYRLGYDNANCIGCVKGGEGYWRAIREDFPAQFEAMAQVEQEVGPGAYLFRDRNTKVRWSLRELGDGPVRRNEVLPACSFFCEMAEQEYAA
jgi:hypothetical protein